MSLKNLLHHVAASSEFLSTDIISKELTKCILESADTVIGYKSMEAKRRSLPIKMRRMLRHLVTKKLRKMMRC